MSGVIDELRADNERLRKTIDAAANLGRLVAFLENDEARIEAFRQACGPELLDRARAALRDTQDAPEVRE